MKSKEVRMVLLELLSDMEWHTTDEIQHVCEVAGIDLSKGRGPIYNVVHKLKSDKKIEGNGVGDYRMIREEDLNEDEDFEREEVCDLRECVWKIEKYLKKYKNTKWLLFCSDEDVKIARDDVKTLLDLANKIKDQLE